MKKSFLFVILIVSAFIFSGCSLVSKRKAEPSNSLKEVTDEELWREIEKDADFSLDQNFAEMESLLK